MKLHGSTIRLLCSATTPHKPIWDPTISLTLTHPTLILLEKCKSRHHLKQILAQFIRTHLISLTFPMSRLLNFTAKSHPDNLDVAILLFNHFTPNRNLYIYNTMISALSSKFTHSFALYNSMIRSQVYPDKHTLHYLLRSCGFLLGVKQVHCQAVVFGLFEYNYFQNSLVKLYVEMGQLGYARNVFENMSDRDRVSFNIVIIEYAKRGFTLEAVELFREMVSLGLEIDEFTMLGLLICCGQLGDLQLGKCVHGWIAKRDLFESNLILCNAVLDMYARCKELRLACAFFGSLRKKDVTTWNTMITGYVKFGELELARELFEDMPNRDIVSSNTLIAGYAQMGDYMNVRRLLFEMASENTKPDYVTVVNLVSAIAETGSLDQGRSVHGLAVKMRMKMDAFLGSALIDMYSKCGNIERAFRVFREVADQDVAVWTTMISGFAYHGNGIRAIELFFEMQKFVDPNHVTFVAVLSACNHSGLLDEGLSVFNSMEEKFGIEPRLEHYGCLVGLLARSGKLEELMHLIENMPMKPSRSIWGSILNACKAQGNVEMAERASTELLKLEPEKEGGYIVLSNMYASSGKWRYSDKIRETMESRGLKKTAGYSSVVVD